MECLTAPGQAPIAELEASVVLSGIGILGSSMGDGEGSKRQNISRTIEMENLSLDISSNRFSRDLLQRFRGTSRDYAAGKGEDDDDDDDVELNLGLSLGGRFGVDKSSKTLVRSSSIASCLPTVRDDSDAAAAAAPPPPSTTLTRTSSLPVETEEEWRKRKEMQSLRRMEAKRRRSEKQRNLRIDREAAAAAAAAAASGGGNLGLSVEERKEIEVNLRGRLDREKTLEALRRPSSSTRSQLRLSDWATGGVNQASDRTRMDSALGKGKGSYAGQPGSQGSVESRGGSSSSASDLDSRLMAGSSDEISPASIQSLQESGSQDAGSSATKARAPTDMESPSSRPDASRSRGREVRSNSMEDMPCVFTKGDGPNGRRVDGILYKYGKGEEVRIMCICHGTFHSPAEFVLHAGGTDVDHPLKHIVVNPNAAPLS